MSILDSTLSELLTLDGSLCAAVVDSNSGMVLASSGTGIDTEIAAAASTDVVRSMQKTIKLLELDDNICDILITLRSQYHIICPCTNIEGLFIYVILDSRRSNLALARRKISATEKNLTQI